MLILKFLGTKGYIEESNYSHKHYSSLLIKIPHYKVLFDCGESIFLKYKPNKIFITHLHPDHSRGIENPEKYLLKKSLIIKGLKIVPFPVLHSIRCPANGFRFEYKGFKAGYFPDVLWIKDRDKALEHLDLYIGDGSTLKRDLVRKNKKTGQIFGHASMKTQLQWVKKYNIPWVIFTHFGKQPCQMGNRKLLKELKKIGGDLVKVEVAKDKEEFKIF